MDLNNLGLGRTTLQVTTGSDAATASGTYAALKTGVLISLTVAEKVTANAAIVLGRTFTLAEVNALWEDFDISDDETYRLITGQDPPTVRDMSAYGSWISSPAMNFSGAPVSPTYQMTPLPQSDSFKVSNHLRAWFEIQIRPRVAGDGDIFPVPGPSMADNGMIGVVQNDKLFVGAKGSDGKREYRAQGAFMRFYDQNLQSLAAGAWEFRYVLRMAKK